MIKFVEREKRLKVVNEIKAAIGKQYSYLNIYPMNSKGKQKCNYKYEYISEKEANIMKHICDKYDVKCKYADNGVTRWGTTHKRFMLYFDYAEEVAEEEAPVKEKAKKEEPKQEAPKKEIPKQEEKCESIWDLIKKLIGCGVGFGFGFMG